MRILRIADVKNNRTGGMSRAMHLTGDEMIRQGHDVQYLFHEDLPTPGPAKLRRFTVPLAIPKLVHQKMAEVGPFDIVEIHEPLAAVYSFKRLRNRALPPVVVFSHGLEERGFQADLNYKREKGLPISLKSRISPLTQIKQSAYAVRHADHVLCCNEEDRQYLAQQGIPIDRLTRHQNGVSDAFLAKTDRSASVPRKGVLFVGTWLMRKGNREIVAGVTQLLRTHQDATFTAAGTGIEEAVVRQAFDADLQPRITVLPSITSDETLIDLYLRHEIFLLPSVFEGQPLVMIEAAAGRMAIITTKICGMKDFVQDNINGRFVAVGDEKGVADALKSLWNDPATCRRLGEAARQTAEQHTWAMAARIILNAYQIVRIGSN